MNGFQILAMIVAALLGRSKNKQDKPNASLPEFTNPVTGRPSIETLKIRGIPEFQLIHKNSPHMPPTVACLTPLTHEQMLVIQNYLLKEGYVDYLIKPGQKNTDGERGF